MLWLETMHDLCFVFDLDDTLFLERDFVLSGFGAVGEWVSARLGLTAFARRAWELFEGGRRGRIFDDVLRECGRDPDPALLAEMVRVYRNHWPRIVLPEDAANCLRDVSRRAPLAMITDGPRLQQIRKCQALRIGSGVFDVVVINERKETQKPHPRGFLELARRCGQGKKRFVYIADNPAKDFATPLSMGWRTVRVRRRGGLHFLKESSPAAQPHFELNDLTSLPKFMA